MNKRARASVRPKGEQAHLGGPRPARLGIHRAARASVRLIDLFCFPFYAVEDIRRNPPQTRMDARGYVQIVILDGSDPVTLRLNFT